MGRGAGRKDESGLGDINLIGISPETSKEMEPETCERIAKGKEKLVRKAAAL